MTSSLLLGALWALLLLGGYLGLPRFLSLQELPARRALLIVGAVALAVRLVPNFILPMGAGYDVESYQIVGDLVRRGKEVYASSATVNRHPYLPLQMYWMALALWSAEFFDFPFVQIVRLMPIGTDVGIAWLLFLGLRRSSTPRDALFGGLAYALNPVPIFVSAYHGQFDAVPTFAILLALYWLEKSPCIAGGWLGLGILNKSWPVLAFPSLWTGTREWRERFFLLGAVAIVPLVGTMIYVTVFGADLGTVLRRALGYNWGVGVWGYTYFFRMLSVLDQKTAGGFYWLTRNGRYLTLIVLGLVWLVRARRQSPSAGFLTILVTFFAITHAFSIQYLMWVVPFAILEQQHRWLTRFTLGAFVYMFLVYTTLILEMHVTKLLPWPQADWYIIMPSGLPVWLVTVWWARERLLGAKSKLSNA